MLLLVLEILILVLLVLVLVLVVVVVVVRVVVVVEVVIVIVEVEVAMIRDEVDGWMLGKCCLFGVSDLFLTFPGILFNFKKKQHGQPNEKHCW